jgi:hypothetical protein
MKGTKMPFRLKVAASLTFIILIAIFVSLFILAFTDHGSDFDKQYKTLVDPYAFNIAAWEINTLYNQAKQNLTHPVSGSSLTSENVLKYFALVESLRDLKTKIQSQKDRPDENHAKQVLRVESQIAELQPVVESTLEKQISLILAEQGIFNPFSNRYLKVILPPVNFELENPPHVLIVSPRNKIERIRDTVIIQNISLAQIKDLESSLEKLNISVIIEDLGGLGATYPSFVQVDADLRFTIDTAAEEWVHQYLAFKPLGFRYVLNLLNISINTDMPTINETVASLTAKEIGKLVYGRYYTQVQTVPTQDPATAGGFDFNKEMREIRMQADDLLAKGQIDRAEQFMREKRDYLELNGYYIRKLNQAYFAFHGSYADSPTSVDPIGEDIRLLRKNSPSIKVFLDTASNLTGKEDLIRAVQSLK